MSLNNDGALTAFDFFAGGGGASLGLHRAGIRMLAALNHSPVAIATHEANFPGAKHLLCDIRVQQSWGLGHADIMWASPDCTHHSIAKGGQSRDAKERALAEELPRFAYNLNANCIVVENVSAFTTWGPVTEKRDKLGQVVRDKKTGEPIMVPIKARKCEYYNQWVATLHALGFVNYEYRLLNSADFGVPQSRVRYFGIFTRRGVPIRWPEPTHDRHGRHGLPKWTAVRTVLDLDDTGRSIFTEWDKGPCRKPGDKPAEKTVRRILAGLRKHVLGNLGTEFLDKRGSNPPSGKPSTGVAGTSPSCTIATCYLPDLVQPAFIHKRMSKPGVGASIDKPSDVIPASWQPDLVTAKFLIKNYGGDPTHQSISLENVAGTATCIDHHTLATAQFVTDNHGWGDTRDVARESPTVIASQDKAPLGLATACMIHMNADAGRNRSLAEPSTTITTSGSRQYLTHFYSGGGQSSAMCHPHPASTCQPHSRLMTPVFLTQYNGGSDDCRVLSLDGPANTVPTENRFGLISLAFLAQSNGVSKGVNPAAKTWRLDTANRTITAGPNQSLVQCLLQAQRHPRQRRPGPAHHAPGRAGADLYLMTYYGTGRLRALGRPCCTIPTHDKAALVRFVRGFVTSSGYEQRPYSLDQAGAPIVASRRHQYLLLAAPGSPVADAADDSPAMRELKEVCRQHGIADIYMRMLKVSELKAIMGFPADYYLAGSATKQKEMLGNAVVPQVSEAIARAMTDSLLAARLRKLPRLRVDAINRYKQASVFAQPAT